ncbi:hypothetical protein J2S40_000223 [Nocardioides luteus]|uniref:Uncharacterized protein n=1 Tax=Nocardioides luteus TaxID=1844 RepID=A0ABQ5SUQ3_9ACTN|nr:hypothetical protein [Nocardioides luteus]MDR7309165.1 hypothetical protein [Nocardioides luteus]GGR49368.1 hypothetical protein GCM10010197_14060 [Nocardioides luteus]GLJ67571.1 hypothetical protein GCM10017579_16070 [Nocardioides luteus]
MRAVQRTIVGVGLALVTITAMALLIIGPDSIDLDPSSRPASQTSGTSAPLADSPDLSTSMPEPPRPVAADEDGSVGTLPPAPGASDDDQLVSRDLVAPPAAAGKKKDTPVDGRALGARNARANKGRGPVGQQGKPDVGAAQQGWRWGEQERPGGRYGAQDPRDSRGDDGDRGGKDRTDRDDRDSCRRHHRYDPYDRDCDRRGWR